MGYTPHKYPSPIALYFIRLVQLSLMVAHGELYWAVGTGGSSSPDAWQFHINFSILSFSLSYLCVRSFVKLYVQLVHNYIIRVERKEFTVFYACTLYDATCVGLARRDEYLCNGLFTRESIFQLLFCFYQTAAATLLRLSDSFSFFFFCFCRVSVSEHVPRHVVYLRLYVYPLRPHRKWHCDDALHILYELIHVIRIDFGRMVVIFIIFIIVSHRFG